jgi:hypothetical protein
LLAIGTAIGISAGLVAPMSAVTAGSPHNSTARGRSSTCQGRATRRSVLTFSVSVMIAAENGPCRPPACFCASQRRRRKSDWGFESGLLQQRVGCELGPTSRTSPTRRAPASRQAARTLRAPYSAASLMGAALPLPLGRSKRSAGT